MNMPEATTHDLIHIRASASIKEASQLMCDLSMGALGVKGADQRFVGLITERDLMWAQAQGKDPMQTKVAEVLNDFPIIVEASITPDAAAERMISGHVRHLIVRGDEDLRIVSMWDLLLAAVEASGVAITKHVASAAEMRRMFGSSFVHRSSPN